MEIEEEKIKKKKNLLTSLAALNTCKKILIAALLIPPGINLCFMFLEIPTAKSLDSSDWLAFWGSYLGSLLGSIAALIALYLTIRQQEEHHESNQELARLQLLPAITCDFHSITQNENGTFAIWALQPNGNIIRSTAANKNVLDREVKKRKENKTITSHIYLRVTNIGTGPAFDVKVAFNLGEYSSIGGFAPSENCFFNLFIEKQQDYEMKITYTDAFGNTYLVKSTLHYYKKGKTMSLEEPTHPVLLSRASN